MKQSTKVDVTPQVVRGTTTRAGQIVRIDCSITGIYDVDDPTGPAVLVQLFVVHLRTRPLPRGTPYELDCAGPVIVELPADASNIHAAAMGASALPVQAPLSSIPLAHGKRLRAEPAMQFALVGQPSLSAGDHTVELSFNLPEARTFREKVIYAAQVSCGHSKYLQPIRPLVTKMAGARALTVQPTENETSVSVPHLFGGIVAYRQATRTLSCPPR